MWPMNDRKWLVRIGILVGVILAASVVADLVHHRMAPPPDFTARDLSGKPWSLAAHRGHHPLIVDFFETTCGPCRMELPHLLEAQRKYADHGLQVVLVTDEPASAVLNDPELSKLPLTILADAREAAVLYQVESIPRTLIFGADGSEIADLEGFDPKGLKAAEMRL